ncbi:MAG: choice-of-anchor Q domain-containing protein [Acidobacteriaceae bacterium]
MQNNGGPTQTIALLPTSPAVDHIPVANCTDTNGNRVTTDQRGISRPQGPACDSGAYELVQSVPFASFRAELGIFGGRYPGFALESVLTLGSTSDGVQPATEAVTLQVGSYTVTIPAGSFHRLRNGSYLYSGTIHGVRLGAVLVPLGRNRYSFDAAATPVNLSTSPNPVTVMLMIGNDSGTTTVNAYRSR